jgi:hypothetical protein
LQPNIADYFLKKKWEDIPQDKWRGDNDTDFNINPTFDEDGLVKEYFEVTLENVGPV